MKHFHHGTRLGILGGGQLGKMLIQSAMNFNIPCAVLDRDPNAPCRRFASQFVNGDWTDMEAVYNFGRQSDLVTIEIENVNCDALEKLEQEGRTVYPQSRVLRLIQDKGLQKQFCRDHGIPSAEFRLVEGKRELADLTDFLPAFQKKRKEGYDGRGVQRLRSADDLEKAFDCPSLLERQVDFEKEISVIVARSAAGELKAFPVAELEFHPDRNLVEFLYSPADISAQASRRATEIALEVANALQIVGLLAVELFLEKSGHILVNEIAPRKHNSGHHTIEANVTSQFEQHLRAIFGMPLGSTRIKDPAVMVNLLGEPGHEGLARYTGMEEVLAVEGVSLHLYGKECTRPYRKMGHITIVDPDLQVAKQKARFVKKTFKVIS